MRKSLAGIAACLCITVAIGAGCNSSKPSAAGQNADEEIYLRQLQQQQNARATICIKLSRPNEGYSCALYNKITKIKRENYGDTEEFIFDNVSYGEYEVLLIPDEESFQEPCIYHETIAVQKGKVEILINVPDKQIQVNAILSGQDPAPYGDGHIVIKVEKVTNGKVDEFYKQFAFIKKTSTGRWEGMLYGVAAGEYKAAYVIKQDKDFSYSKAVAVTLKNDDFEKGSILLAF